MVATRRAVQAAATRDEILAAARKRFSTAGYAATSIKDIAVDAGVSVQTIYDSVGSKADLVRGLNDLIDTESNITDITGDLRGDSTAVARMPARITARMIERCGDIIRAVLAAERVDPDLAIVLSEGNRRHRAGASMVATRLEELGALRPGLTVAEATISIAALTDARLAVILIDDHALSTSAIEDWMADMVVRAVLGSVQ